MHKFLASRVDAPTNIAPQKTRSTRFLGACLLVAACCGFSTGCKIMPSLGKLTHNVGKLVSAADKKQDGIRTTSRSVIQSTHA